MADIVNKYNKLDIPLRRGDLVKVTANKRQLYTCFLTEILKPGDILKIDDSSTGTGGVYCSFIHNNMDWVIKLNMVEKYYE